MPQGGRTSPSKNPAPAAGACKAQRTFATRQETGSAVCARPVSEATSVQMCQRETGPERSDHQPDPAATHKTWGLRSSLFSRRVRAVRRRLSVVEKPTLKSTKEEIHKDTSRSRVPSPGWGLPSLLENTSRKPLGHFPGVQLLSQWRRWLPTSSPPPWPSSTHRAGQTQAGDLLRRGHLTARDKHRILNSWKKPTWLIAN